MNVTVIIDRDRKVTAPAEEWVVAIIHVLSPAQRSKLFEMLSKKVVGYATPGHHVLKAEGFPVHLLKG